MNICVIGGAGYVGHPLSLKLARAGHKVKIIDTLWYGEAPEHSNITIIQEDIRQSDWSIHFKDTDIVYLLACVSNDPSSELDHDFTTSINDDAVNRAITACKTEGIKRLIYTSSSSVYGIKSEPKVTEDLKLEPLTLYSELKVKSEELVRKLTDEQMDSVILRPATVFGPAKRLRLDVVINLLAAHAFYKKEVKIFGGNQYRPNIFIDDIVDINFELADLDKGPYRAEVFNLGSENLSVREIGELIKKHCPHPIKMSTIESDDNRSYRIDSTKARETLGLNNFKSIESGIQMLFEYFSNHPEINPDDARYNNVKNMKSHLNMIK